MKIEFTIEFLGPFSVSTGQAGRAADSMVDDDRPLPETSIKGLMRASAVGLGVPGELIGRTFGGATASAWNWGAAAFVQPPVRQLQGSTAIDDSTNTALKRALVFTERHWSTTATFDIQQTMFLDPNERELQRVILTVGACGIQSIGNSRRRGNGWVSITPSTVLTPQDRFTFDSIFEMVKS
jgi:hypothetical protein